MWKKMGDAGFLGITVGEEHGGMAMGYQAHCIVMEELSRASGTFSPSTWTSNLTHPGSIALSYAAHSQLCINQIRLHATPEQAARHLPGLVAGTSVGALAMSEHGAGSDVVSMRTTARPVDGGYLLSGTKMWITNGPDADVVVVYAKTDREAGSKGISAFIVETRNPNTKEYVKGFSVAQKLDKLGMRGSNTGELVLDDVFVPASSLLGPLNGGAKVLMSGLDLERLVLSAGPLGLMRAALDHALPYTHARKQFGEPVAHNQLMQGKLADMYVAYATASALTYSVAAAVDGGQPSHFLEPQALFPAGAPDGRAGPVRSQDCAAAILYAAEQATQVALDAIQCLGGTGYVNEVAVGRLLRDAKLYEIGAGTSEIRRLVIGRSFNRMYDEK
jgi:isovaleryl-CoA dehydrogenase